MPTETITDLILTVLRGSQEPLSSRAVIEALALTGRAENSVHGGLSKLVTNRKVKRTMDVASSTYLYNLTDRVASLPPAETTTTLTTGMDAPCALPAARTVTIINVRPEQIERDVLDALDDEIGYSFGDLQRETGNVYSEAQIRAALGDLAARNLVRTRRAEDGSRLEFCRIGEAEPVSFDTAVQAATVEATAEAEPIESAASAVPAEAVDASPKVKAEDEARCVFPPGPGAPYQYDSVFSAEDVPHVGFARGGYVGGFVGITQKPLFHPDSKPRSWRDVAREPLGMRDRLWNITRDMDELMLDACDAEVPHSLLKELLSGAMALRHAVFRI